MSQWSDPSSHIVFTYRLYLELSNQLNTYVRVEKTKYRLLQLRHCVAVV